jgi:hypothetical protein
MVFKSKMRNPGGNKANLASSGAIANQTVQLGFRRAFLVRDPHGHVIQIEEK